VPTEAYQKPFYGGGGFQGGQGGFGGQQNQGASTSNYKTVLCKNFEQSGQCRYGNSCTFAHGGVEVKKSPEYGNPMGNQD